MLELTAVRNLARQHGLTEIYCNDSSKLVSFLSESTACRINVYHTTGTVGTCLCHPFKGKTQLFRRGQTLSSLAMIFQNPRIHTGEGYYRRVETCVDGPQEKKRRLEEVSELVDVFFCSTEEDAMKRELQNITKEESELKFRRQSVEACLAAIEAERQRVLKAKHEAEEVAAKELERIRARQAAEEAERARVAAVEHANELNRQKQLAENAQRLQRGKYFKLQLPSFDNASAVKNHCTATASCLALCHNHSFVVVNDNKQITWTSGLPNNLHTSLTTCKQRITYVAVGPDNQYFIRKENGSSQWNGTPTSFGDCIRQESVQKVAFGTDDAWLVILTPGSYNRVRYEGMPFGLIDTLKERNNKRRSVNEITIAGENNQYWFVSFTDGYYECVLPTIIQEDIAEAERQGCKIRHVYFTVTTEDDYYYDTETCDFIIRYGF